MDYTKQELRPLIYKDREDIDEFDISNTQSLDAEMLRQIEVSEIIKLDGASKYILDIFNNAYYITTLIMMERHPVHYLSKYILIAEHTSSAYYNIYEKNTNHKLFSAIIMAMVNNYIRSLDDKYLKSDNIFLKQLNSHFNDIGPFYSSDELGSFNLYQSFLLNDNLKDFRVKKDSFKPRTIDYQAVSEMESILYNKKKSDWRTFTDDYNEERIAELFDFCRNEYSASFLAAHIRREANKNKKEEIVEFIDILDWKKLSTIHPKEATFEIKYTWLINLYNKLNDEYEKLKNKFESSNSENCNDMIEEEDNDNKKVLSREKASLFVLSVANTFSFNYTNKKKDLAPVVNSLFGWGKASAEKRLCEGFKKDDIEDLAQIFDTLSPQLSQTIRNKGDALPKNEVTP